MDPIRFEALTRLLRASPTRRSLGRRIGALALGGVAASVGIAGTAAKTCGPCRTKKRKGKCKGYKPNGTFCTISSKAVYGGTCQNGGCVPNPAPVVPLPPPPAVPAALLGRWREEVQFACGTGTEITPALPIGELEFRADGTLAVTWIPFEVYHDYFATFVADLTQGTLRFQVSGGNYIPPDIDGEGHIAFDAQGRLLLTDLWLGSPPRSAGPVGCGHRFHKPAA